MFVHVLSPTDCILFFAKTSDLLIGNVVEPNPISARGQSEFAVLLEKAGQIEPPGEDQSAEQRADIISYCPLFRKECV
jgi:hypothetical protein